MVKFFWNANGAASNADIDLFSDCMAHYSTVCPIGKASISFVFLVSAQFWIGKVSNEGQKRRENGKGGTTERAVSFSPRSRENLGYWISHEIKENKEPREVVSGTPCVQSERKRESARRWTISSRRGSAVRVWGMVRTDWLVEGQAVRAGANTGTSEDFPGESFV